MAVTILSVQYVGLVILLILPNIRGTLFEPRITPYQLQEEISYRLPNNTYPTVYDLALETWVDEGRLDYNGSVNIRIKAIEDDSDSITLHSRNLTLLEWNLQKMVSEELIPVPLAPVIVFEPDTDFVTFVLSDNAKLERDVDYRLFITFSGQLREEQNGFYRSSYTNSGGREVWFANAIFQLTEARTTFPCYDEPERKAHFNIKIFHSPDYHAISNTEVTDISVIPDSPHVVTTFRLIEPTMTYVLAFMISDFSAICNNESLVTQCVHASPNKIADMSFALEAGVKTLSVFEEYLNVSYKLAKFDQLGLPNFAPLSTENWGLVQYNEDFLVFNPASSRATQEFTVARLISHQLSHQWFGNLVSPTWWSYSWLIEGFAVLAEYEITQMTYPDLRSDDMFPHRITQWIFNPDSLESSRALTMYGESKEEIDQLFDGLAFFKAGSIFRMTENFLTAPVWRNGLNRYLTAHQYFNADGDDFFDALQEAVTEFQMDLPTTVKDILDTWTLQKGFPIVEVIRRYNAEGSIRFSQRRYVSTTKDIDDGLTWWIPINIATKSVANFETTTPDYWLSKGVGDALYDSPMMISNDDWIVVNKQQTGYYRVNYDNENWLKLANELMNGDMNSIHLLSRGQLVDDALEFGQTNRLDLDVVLSIISYLQKEVEYVVWASANEGLLQLFRTFRGIDNQYFLQFFNEITKLIYNALGARSKSNELHHTKLARNLAIQWACLVGNSNCLSDTATIMDGVIYQNDTIEADLLAVIYCNGMRDAKSTKFTALWEKFTASEMDRNVIIDGLVCNENANNLKTFLTDLFGGMASDVEKRRAFNGVFAASQTGLSSALQYFSVNTLQIETVYGTSMGTLLVNIASQIHSISEREAFDRVIGSLESRIDAAIISSVRATVQSNLEYVDEHADEVERFLTTMYDKSGSRISAVVSYLSMAFITISLIIF